MDWLSLDDLNWLAVLVAFVVSFVLGWLWYSQWAFFPAWSKADGLTEEKMKSANMGAAFAGTALANLLGVVLLAMLMAALGTADAGSGAVLGAAVGLAFRGGAHVLHNGFAVRHWKVSLIDTAHDTLALALAGAILGLMG